MSVLAYPRTNDEDIFRHCTKDCGVVSATEDFQYFALRCVFCSEKFLYFDAFIGHMQTVHLEDSQHQRDRDSGAIDDNLRGLGMNFNVSEPITLTCEAAERLADGITPFDEIEDLTDADTALLEPQMVIKQELQEMGNSDDDEAVADEDDGDGDDDEDEEGDMILPETSLQSVGSHMSMPTGAKNYMDIQNEDSSMDADDNSNEYPEYGNYGSSFSAHEESDFLNYDEMVEESLLGQRDGELTMHIKDRKMIQFLIHSYKRNPFLWDHGDLQFRDRGKRARFLDWIVQEFKTRFNISLAKDAITRKWDNLRTVYKRECNRMSLEKTNISTLWYFKELHFLNELYSYNAKMSETVIKETSYRRRFSAIWNDTSTAKLLSMVKRYQCFYNRFDPDYRSKEKRGEALQQMAMELQQQIGVTSIQISKRISQLRFDYSKQKVERLNCERMGRKFIPNYIYYDHMYFMDDDVPPFKCQHCSEIVQTLRELDLHMLTHQPSLGGGYYCNVCNIQFHNAGEFDNHKQLHLGAGNDTKFKCELCTASFREKSNYDEHLRRHNDELFLPSLALNHSILDNTDSELAADGGNAAGGNGHGEELETAAMSDLYAPEPPKPFPCDICHRTFSTPGHLNTHRIVHQDERDRCYKCDYPQCNKAFVSRHSLFEHLKQHYSNEEFKCDICGKTFKSTKNLQNHKQIHDKVKRYVCQICGSAFAQAAGLYLHKRRHNRPSGTGTLATLGAAAGTGGGGSGSGGVGGRLSRSSL